MEGTGGVGLHPRRARPEARLKTPRRIGILGHVGNGNLGDEAIIDALIRGVREVAPDALDGLDALQPAEVCVRLGRALRPRLGTDRFVSLAYAVLAIVGFGAVTLSLTLMALRTRTS